nr:hypothetical protein [Ensifer sp. IC4062]
MKLGVVWIDAFVMDVRKDADFAAVIPEKTDQGIVAADRCQSA